jgi:hypothetical protein
MSLRHAIISFIVLASLALIATIVHLSNRHAVPQVDATKVRASNGRPFLAIWQDSNRDLVPRLRVAIWDSGRVLFANDLTKWSDELREGRIAADRIARLKADILESDIFDLKGTCYLVPDAPVDCMMLDFGEQTQMLFWDERESQFYGINYRPNSNQRKFKACWKRVNELALKTLPSQSQPVTKRFPEPPASWHLKRPIQSE